MSTRAYADQLRNGLMQVRDKLIAAMDAADGTMNAAEAKLAQQTADVSDRAEARERAVLLQRVMTVTESGAVQVGNLTDAIVSAAGTSDDAATGLISALEDAGRVVRGCVDAKDSLLGEVDRVAGIARNHLRSRSAAGGTVDPLCLLADRVARSVAAAGEEIEGMQQLSVKASILAAQSSAAAVHDQWREAASAVTTLVKEASAARQDAATILAATLGASQEARAARFVTWEQRTAADQVMLAFREGLKDVDSVVNGSLRVSRTNPTSQGSVSPGLSATFRIAKPDGGQGASSDRGAADPNSAAAPRVAFVAVPSEAANGFTRSAAAAAISPPPDPSGEPTLPRSVDGELDKGPQESGSWSYQTKEPLTRDVNGDDLAFGRSYRVFAAQLDSNPGTDGGSGGNIGQLSLASLPLTAARTVKKMGHPRVQRLATTGPGRNAFVVCFDRVTLTEDDSTPDSSLFECRLLLIRESVWEAWAGQRSAPSASGGRDATQAKVGGKASAKTITGGRPGSKLVGPKADKAGKDSKDGKGAGQANETTPEAIPPTEEVLESRLALEREVRLATGLNGADWTTLEPRKSGSLKDQVLTVWKRYTEDMTYVRGAGVKPLTEDQIAAYAAAFGGDGKEATPVEYLCYFNPYATALDQGGVTVGRYTDIAGDLLDLDLTRYVAVVFVAGVPQANNEIVVEAAISDPSSVFGPDSVA